jgi:THUMP domain-like
MHDKLTPEIEDFIQKNQKAKTADLVFKIRKQFNIAPDFIINQINGRNKAPQKLPSWAKIEGLVYPSALSVEQCSSEITARFKASLLGGNQLLDLSGGFGVDTYFCSNQFKRVDYCERDADLFAVVSHNFKQLNATNIRLHLGDMFDFLNAFQGKADWIYLDPARRADGDIKVFSLEQCSPDITQMMPLLWTKTDNILLKLSPMLDLAEIGRKLANVQQIWVVSVKNECKEVLVHLSNNPDADSKIHAVDLQEGENPSLFSATTLQKQGATIQLSPPQSYIYEPFKAILKADLQQLLAHQNGLSKLDYRSNFFTSEMLKADFMGRIFSLKSVIKPKKAQIKAHLANGKANVIARNFPLSAEQISAQFNIVPGGNVYLLATQLQQQEKVILVCERVK